MEDAWLEAEWFDSDSVIRQVLECKHMEKADECARSINANYNNSAINGDAENLSRIFPKGKHGNYRINQ